jgi:hypothetical protein
MNGSETELVVGAQERRSVAALRSRYFQGPRVIEFPHPQDLGSLSFMSIAVMPDIAAFDDKDGVFGDVRGMIADAFQISRDQD